jgi:hypothetical protein
MGLVALVCLVMGHVSIPTDPIGYWDYSIFIITEGIVAFVPSTVAGPSMLVQVTLSLEVLGSLLFHPLFLRLCIHRNFKSVMF